VGVCKWWRPVTWKPTEKKAIPFYQAFIVKDPDDNVRQWCHVDISRRLWRFRRWLQSQKIQTVTSAPARDGNESSSGQVEQIPTRQYKGCWYNPRPILVGKHLYLHSYPSSFKWILDIRQVYHSICKKYIKTIISMNTTQFTHVQNQYPTNKWDNL
jgi:hypothetical protein